MTGAARSKPHRRLIGQLMLLAVAMFGFGFLLVPLYDVFCDLTGLGGKTSNSQAVVSERPDTERTVRVEFVATLGQFAPWDFRPTVSHMHVHPGKLYKTAFYAENLADKALVGYATPSVAPGRAAKFFKKTECFCFTPQPFAEGESRDMPVAFSIDPELPAHIDTVTLSYTFFADQQIAQH